MKNKKFKLNYLKENKEIKSKDDPPKIKLKVYKIKNNFYFILV